MKFPMRFKYYDNWVKYPLIISGLFSGYGLGSWIINYLAYLALDIPEIARNKEELTYYLLVGLIFLGIFWVCKYFNYKLK